MRFLKTYPVIAIAAIMLLCGNGLKAQTGKSFQVAGGLATTWIVGSNVAQEGLIPQDTIDKVGGGFNGQQLGASLRLIYGMNEANTIRLNTGLDYYFLRGTQRLSGKAAQGFVNTETDLPTIALGIDYAFVEYPPGNARIYAGLEARGTFIISRPSTLRLIRLGEQEPFQQEVFASKENTFRAGGAVRLGIEGEIFHPLFVNISTAYGVANLIGRNDARGELLTPAAVTADESGENFLHTMFFSFLLQYRF